MTRLHAAVTCVSLAALSATAVPAAWAVELNDLDADLPNAVEDAIAVDPGRFELHGAARYDRVRGRDAVRLLSRVQLGLVEGLQASLALPYGAGSGRGRDPGAADAGLLYNFARERGPLPALAVALDYIRPVGPERRGTQVGLTGIATKTLDPAADRRVHLNLAWLRGFDPGEDERRNRYRVVVGYSQPVAPNLLVVLDYVRESQDRRERDANIVEAGVHYHVSDALILGAAAGFGVGRDSPRARAVVSIQIGFGGR